MEIKIYCSCGSKYKFDVEPVNGHMPSAIACPTCGADGTAAANDIIQQNLSAVPTPVPVAAPTSGLRVRQAESHAPAAPPPPAIAPRPIMPSAIPAKKSEGVLKTTLTLILVGFVVLGVGYKWYRRIARIARTAGALAGGGDSSASENRNLELDNGVTLFIKHSNHLEVAQACENFWTNKLQRKVLMVPGSGHPEWGGKEYAVSSSHNGYVRVFGNNDWPEALFDGLSKSLSEQFNTTVIENQEVSFSGAFVFGVYENGNRQMFAKKIVKINAKKDDVDEVVTVDGKEWAQAHGFKPEGKDGWDDFDGEIITKRLGVKMWDEKEGGGNYVLIREVGAAAIPTAIKTNARPARVRTAAPTGTSGQ